MSQQDDRRTSDEIEHEIHQTRARLDETLHEIEERFSPQKLMNTTYDYLRHGGAEDAVTSIGRAIRENPLPVMVTGIGLGWLLLAQRRSSHAHDDRGRYAGGYPGSTMPATRMPDGGDMAGSTVSGAGTTSMGHDPAALGATPQHSSDEHGHGGMTQKAQHMAGNMKNRAQHMGSQVRDRAQHMSDQMRERAQHMGGSMRSQGQGGQPITHRARDAGSQAGHFVQDHPLVAGALGVAMGAVLGSLFSPTRVENEYLGDIRDRAMHRATEAGQEQAERAQEKLHETAERVKSEAREHGAQPARETNSSNASSYVENPSSEERYAKAGSASGTGVNAGRESAASKGGTGVSSTTAQGSGQGSGTGTGAAGASTSHAPGSGSKPGDSGSTP
ncbi:DUF3618 domain-containing protein [Billgrantia diversa]|uniref:DUF3618 domain-containing protein n=1 Tax=Halomonas sp. MCCC 1A13316 TaxID=2733487 RepID=UPI0018A6A656|nr:DUF3618 domain-containing protein [Halomonas sp. MCCC 1A13316]QOR37667.1 DUF3618 domain-containing protein [Halomonas sp. MCCC 1A13316]